MAIKLLQTFQYLLPTAITIPIVISTLIVILASLSGMVFLALSPLFSIVYKGAVNNCSYQVLAVILSLQCTDKVLWQCVYLERVVYIVLL